MLLQLYLFLSMFQLVHFLLEVLMVKLNTMHQMWSSECYQKIKQLFLNFQYHVSVDATEDGSHSPQLVLYVLKLLGLFSLAAAGPYSSPTLFVQYTI